MKRFFISLGMIALIGFVCWLSFYQISDTREKLLQSVEAIQTAADREDTGAMLSHIKELEEYWHEEERQLMHFVRHGQIDSITESVSKLHPLAEYGDIPEMLSELNSILWQIEHLWETEKPLWRNIFRAC